MKLLITGGRSAIAMALAARQAQLGREVVVTASTEEGRASLEEAYAGIDRDEVWLYGCDIPEYLQANRMNHKPKRPRKLLLHRREIAKFASKSVERGLTLVPLQIYFKKGIAKVEICIARGRKLYDKRQELKKQDAKRDIDRALRRVSRGGRR